MKPSRTLLQLVASFAVVREWPAIGVAAGSIAGAVVNFLSSKYWIFRAPKGKSVAS
jgi:putative flippase GtrA